MQIDWSKVFADSADVTSLLVSLGLLVLAGLVGYVAYRILRLVLRRLLPQTPHNVAEILLRHSGGALRLLLPLICVLLAEPAVRLPGEASRLLQHVIAIALIMGVGWLLTALVRVMRDYLFLRYDVTVKDNLRARQVRTQVDVVAKILIAIILVLALAAVLMTFDKVRQVGVGLLASAGMVGIIAGFAAQHSLSTLFAGLQLALTQPIRLDDVVTVEGEWGRIEEITLTYVVVCIWDQRRLVVPVTWFLHQPFQNWTRTTAELLGTVLFYVDYGVDVAALRAELQQLLAASPLWDGRAWGLQVTNATERCLELRALMSAADASRAWELRCDMREKLLIWLQRHHPEQLPRLRAEVGSRASLSPPPAESETPATPPAGR